MTMHVYVERVPATGAWLVDIPALHRYSLPVGAREARDMEWAAMLALARVAEPTDSDDVVVHDAADV